MAGNINKEIEAIRILPALFTLFPLVFCPGPMTLFAMSYGVAIGYRKTLIGLLGGTSAYLLQMSLTYIALHYLQKHPFWLHFVYFIGIAYISQLSVTWFFKDNVNKIEHGSKEQVSFYSVFSQGFLIAFFNPKAVLVYIAVFPVILGKPLVIKQEAYMVLCFMFIVLQLLSASCYAIFGEYIFAYFESRRKMHWINKIVSFLLFCVVLTLIFI